MTHFVSLAMSLATALRSLHERKLIHKDLRRMNVLVHFDTAQVRLTVSVWFPVFDASVNPPEFIAGTLP
jgi:Ser/Thr protein kinase RdoA (MazF antagonist)